MAVQGEGPLPARWHCQLLLGALGAPAGAAPGDARLPAGVRGGFRRDVVAEHEHTVVRPGRGTGGATMPMPGLQSPLQTEHRGAWGRRTTNGEAALSPPFSAYLFILGKDSV